MENNMVGSHFDTLPASVPSTISWPVLRGSFARATVSSYVDQQDHNDSFEKNWFKTVDSKLFHSKLLIQTWIQDIPNNVLALPSQKAIPVTGFTAIPAARASQKTRNRRRDRGNSSISAQVLFRDPEIWLPQSCGTSAEKVGGSHVKAKKDWEKIRTKDNGNSYRLPGLGVQSIISKKQEGDEGMIETSQLRRKSEWFIFYILQRVGRSSWHRSSKPMPPFGNIRHKHQTRALYARARAVWTSPVVSLGRWTTNERMSHLYIGLLKRRFSP